MNKLAFGAKPAVLRCGQCGKFVDREDARLQRGDDQRQPPGAVVLYTPGVSWVGDPA